jgi:hypothetical protein
MPGPRPRASCLTLDTAAYERALATKLVQSSAEQLVPLVLARAGYERRRIEAGDVVEEAFLALEQAVKDGIALVRKGAVLQP